MGLSLEETSRTELRAADAWAPDAPVRGAPVGRVAALGGGAEACARLYAWLTDRAYLGRVEEPTAAAEVYVTLVPNVTRKLLNELYAGTDAVMAPGLIHAPDEAALLEQVLQRAIGREVPHGGPVVRLLPLQRGLAPSPPGDYRADTPPDELRRIVGSEPGVLMIHTHSDGIDAFLHPDLALCPMRVERLGAPHDRPPLCIETGRCHRSRTVLGDPEWRDAVLHPAEVSGRIVLLNVCSGVLDPRGAVDPAWGLVAALLDSPRIGAVVLTWTVVRTSTSDFDGLLDHLEAGLSLGSAVAQHNAEVEPGRGGRVCLFGDPDLRLAPREGLGRLRGAASTDFASPAADLAGIAFLRPYMEAASIGYPKPAALEALEAARLYDLGARSGWPVEGAGRLGDTLRAALLAFLNERGCLIYIDWTQISDPAGPSRRVACPHCGGGADAAVRRIRSLEADPRVVVICDACGVVEDRPERLSAGFRLEPGGRLLLTGPLPDGAQLAVRLGAQEDALSVTHPWPAGEDGRPAPAFTPPDGWPPGLVRLSLIVIAGASVALLSVPTRAPSGASAC